MIHYIYTDNVNYHNTDFANYLIGMTNGALSKY